MSSLGALVQNENMKIFRRLRTWIMVLLLLGALGLMTGLIKWNDFQTDQTNWREQVEQSVQNNKAYLAKMPDDALPEERKEIEDAIKTKEYALEHDINPNEQTLWDIVGASTFMILLVTMLTVIVAADMVAAEFTWGTVKLLLVRPASRGKILLSKYISTLMFALFLLVLTFAASVLFGGLAEGFGTVSYPALYVGADGAVHEQSMVISVLQKYGLNAVQLVMYVTFAFMISAAFRSSAMAIAFSLFFMLVGNTLVMIFRQYEWVKYVLFANIDLSQYLAGGTPIRPEMTLQFSVIMLVAYFAVFHIVSWLLFTKRDVAA